MKLFTKYNRLNLTLMVAVFLLSSIVYYFLLKYVLIQELDEDLVEKKEKIEAYVSTHNTLPVFEDLDDVQVFYEPSTNIISKSSLTLVDRYDAEERRRHGFRQLVYGQQLINKYYTVTIIKPLEGMHSLLRIIVGITISTILVIIIASIILNRLLLRKLWKPFYDTVTSMRLFKLSRKHQPEFPHTDIDEFVFLKDNLNDTIAQAQMEYHLLKEFTENASHEFQTPLAIIRSKLDLLIQEEDLSERQSELLRHTYSSIKKLSRLNQSLLLLTKIENNQFPITEKVELKAQLEEKIQQFQELWQNNHITVSVKLEESIVCANPELVDILLNNLLSNASKHNISGGSIAITLNASVLAIENTGSAIQLDERRLFRRFYKEEQHNQSNGLGLSIIKEICEQAGIEIHYSFVNQRHIFALTLPAVNNEAPVPV